MSPLHTPATHPAGGPGPRAAQAAAAPQPPAVAGERFRPVVQVPPSAYGRRYLSLVRSMLHWHQAREACEACEAADQGSVLEIGPGSGHTTWLMRHWGLKVTTLDLDPALRPDVVGDVTELPFEDGRFDVAMAAEVLEHLPFDRFGHALRELRRVARRCVIVTLPAPLVGGSMLLNLPGLRPLGLSLGLPLWTRHRFDGQHHWELGKRGSTRAQVEAVMRDSGLRIERSFRPAPSLYCRFYRLRP